MRHQSLHFDFPIIANDESMQTIKDKRKYKSQQLFKMLSLSLDTWLKSFSPLAWALSTMVSWKSAQTLTTHSFSSGRVLASCTCAAAWCCCCHGNCAVSTQPISSFSNPVNRQLSADAFPEEIIHNGHILNFDELYQPVLGVRFFWDTVYMCTHISSLKYRKQVLTMW